MGKLTVQRYVIGALAGVAVGSGVIALILSLVKITSVTLPPSFKYGMVFDAGSTHTSLFVYKWLADKENGTGLVTQLLLCDVDGPGISSYSSDPPRAGQSLRSCLDTAAAAIPSERQRESPVYLGATAGMRLLEMQSPVETEQVLAEVRNTIRSYPFDFRGARIISGAEEGAYGWITINYLLSSFIKFSYEGKWKHPKNGNLLGALDLGGASTQITFAPKEQIKDKQSEASFRLYGYEHTVYTHSFLCYGKEQFMNKILAKLVKEHSISSPVPHPCFPAGYQLNTTLGDIFSSPCTSKPEPYTPASAVTFKGSGTPAQCEALVKTLVNLSACTGKPECSFDGVYQPPVQGSYFAFAAFFYTFDFLKLAPQSTLDVTRRTIAAFCSRDWKSLKVEFPSEKDSRLREYCGAGYYITTLLVDAYKFDNQSWNNIVFQKKADDTDIGWTLGYMLNLTNLVPSEAPPEVKGHDYDVWVGSLFFIVLAIAVCLLAIAVQCLGSPD